MLTSKASSYFKKGIKLVYHKKKNVKLDAKLMQVKNKKSFFFHIDLWMRLITQIWKANVA